MVFPTQRGVRRRSSESLPSGQELERPIPHRITSTTNLWGPKMKYRSLKNLDDPSLINEFAATAADLGDAINCWESGNKQTNRLFTIRDEIRARGNEVRLQLVTLLKHDN